MCLFCGIFHFILFSCFILLLIIIIIVLFIYLHTITQHSRVPKKRSRYSVNAWETGFTQFTFGSLIAVQVLFFQTGLKCNIHKEKLFLLAKGKHDLAWRQRHFFYIAWTWKLLFQCDFMPFVPSALISNQRDVECLSVFICLHYWMKWNTISFVFFRAFVLVARVCVPWTDIILEGSGPDRCWCLSGSVVTLRISSVVRSQSTVMQKNKHFSRRFCLKPNSLTAQPPFSLLLHHMSHISSMSHSVASA